MVDFSGPQHGACLSASSVYLSFTARLTSSSLCAPAGFLTFRAMSIDLRVHQARPGLYLFRLAMTTEATTTAATTAAMTPR